MIKLFQELKYTFIVSSLFLFILLLPQSLYAQEKKAAEEKKTTQSTWQFGCGKTKNQKEICQIQRDIRQNEGKDLIARVYFVRETDKKTAVTRFVLPLDVSLPYGVRYSVTKGGKRSEPVQVAYQHCSKDGCVAAGNFTDELAKSMREGATFHVGFASKTLKGIEINIDLKGFTAIHDKFVKGGE